MQKQSDHADALPVEQLRDGVEALMESVSALLDDEVSLATLETALHSHDALREQLTAYTCDASALDALARIENYISRQAVDYYQAASAELNEHQHSRFITLFARQLLDLDGVGPATAGKLFQQGVVTPDDFFALPPQAIATLELPSATISRLITLHGKGSTDTAK